MIKEILDKIIREIRISDSGQIIHKENATIHFLHEDTVSSLTKIIYNNNYVSSQATPLGVNPNFADTLKTANTSNTIKHTNWLIIHENADGSIVVQKNNRRLVVFPGTYILEKFSKTGAAIGEKVTLVNFLDYDDEASIFFFTFGNELRDDFNESLTRFYFNILPNKLPDLITYLTTELNRIKVPFQFKCIKKADFFYRADKAILYIEKRYLNLTISTISDVKVKFNTVLINNIPLFTRRLAPGIAFAENPVDPNESFGTSRCRLIAEAIVEAHEKNIKDVKFHVLQYIEKKGYDLDKFYLNPGSRFEYDFSAFE